ncbi:hypothetical protein Rhow_002457 [Rhodococcus wratislaviensis]|uniref:Uncharacterized protein n=1 Tax=Rhodococcus wratislaviensis TaxID=44752 RepID=A0A402C5Q6_RHOWR|nr:hypothetical protein Rhow_002457 [Rhodococcus wratislaviensis]
MAVDLLIHTITSELVQIFHVEAQATGSRRLLGEPIYLPVKMPGG